MSLPALLATAYLLGAIPTAYIVVRLVTGIDVRRIGSGNPGMMNVLDSVGFRWALVVGVADILKGIGAVGLAFLVGVTEFAAIVVAAVAVVGHDFSVFLRFRGGNGTATTIGGVAALLPLPTFIAFVVALAALPLVRSRRLAGLLGMVLVPVLGYLLGAPDAWVLGAVALLTLTSIKVAVAERAT